MTSAGGAGGVGEAGGVETEAKTTKTGKKAK